MKNYWVADGFFESKITSKVFPDGCTDIIFTIDKTKGYSSINLFGIMTSFVEVNYPSSAQMFGIRFRPAGLAAFTRMPISELTNQSAELALLETLFDKSFYEALPEKKSVAEIIAHTNQFLIKQLPNLYYFDKQIVRAVDLISHKKGQLNLTDVASDVCLCQRHFERKFKSVVGVSPKMFAKIFRFKNALQHMQMFAHKDLLTIALECGYYDHTHLAKDFKLFTGDTPTDFRRKKSIFYAYADEYNV
ncbi:MAG: helix-turn-helix domain-containing protein [Prevotellaceae bacterium]|nr:helix-turn-helix domain-containing protein [Prevotellaceae bacterium]